MTRTHNTKEDRRALILACLNEIRKKYVANGNSKRGLFISQIGEKYHVALPPFRTYEEKLKNPITMETADEVIDILFRYNKAKADERNKVSITEDCLPGLENEQTQDPVQLSIDYDKARIADALETIILELRSIGEAIKGLDFRPVVPRRPPQWDNNQKADA